MTRFLAGADPIDILAIGSCHIDKSISVLEGSEKYDTASCIVRYPGGVQAMIDVCRQSSFGYDQRAEVLGTGGMVQTDNVYPNTAKLFKPNFTGNAGKQNKLIHRILIRFYLDYFVLFRFCHSSSKFSLINLSVLLPFSSN
jgi:predicted dehydrogenase